MIDEADRDGDGEVNEAQATRRTRRDDSGGWEDNEWGNYDVCSNSVGI